MGTSRFVALLAVGSCQAVLAAAFVGVGRPGGAAAALAVALAGLAVLASRLRGGPTSWLLASLLLAVLSVLAGAPLWLAALATALALAAWSLCLLGRDLHPGGGGGEGRLLRNRLGALATGILPGLGLALLAGRAELEIPFFVMLGLGAAALLALYAAVRSWG